MGDKQHFPQMKETKTDGTKLEDSESNTATAQTMVKIHLQ